MDKFGYDFWRYFDFSKEAFVKKYYLSVFFLIFSGCKVGPNYKLPEYEIPDIWTQNCQEPLPVISNWWEEFNDPLLNKFILKAKEENLDLLIAEAKIIQARSIRQVSASKLFPQVGADLNGTKTYFSKNGPVFAIGQATGDPNATSSLTDVLPFSVQIPQIQNLFNALFDVSWEIDFFGKTRRAVERDQAYIEASMEAKNACFITMAAEISKNYMELRHFQKQNDILQKLIENYEESLILIKSQNAEGLVSDIDLENIAKDLELTKSRLPDVVAEIYQRIYLLSILLGDLPETFVDELLSKNQMPEIPKSIGLGLRSDLVRRRPDVRMAERKLAAATAEIGVNVANFFPSVSLLGTGGFQSLLFPKLFNWGSKTWAYGSDISMPVFQGGRLLGNLHLSQAEQVIAGYEYQKVILQALQEAESSFSYFSEGQISFGHIQQFLEKSQNILKLTDRLYQEGLIDLLALLAQQRQTLDAEEKQNASHLSVVLSSISLYKSLGAGFAENLDDNCR